MTHDQLLQQAKDAVQELFGDSSVIEEARSCVEAIKSDLKRAGDE